MNTYPPPSSAPPAERVRAAWQRRHDTDYIFNFWTALGWTILTIGIYGFYVFYQLMRRMRDHNVRRLELLEAANEFAWEHANATGAAEELRPAFERIGANLAPLRSMTSDFRDPLIWTLLSLIGGVVHIVAYILLDGDLVRHGQAEAAIESDLAAVFGRLGQPLPTSPAPVKGKHNYVGRIIASIVSCGFYVIWWLYNMMAEPNEHFEANWAWEDDLAQSVQGLAGVA